MLLAFIVSASIIVSMIFMTTGYREPSPNSGGGWAFFWIVAALLIGSMLP